MAEGYDPHRSTVTDDKLAAFVSLEITGDLNEVPGIGPKSIELLKEQGISTTFGLFGKFLCMKEEGVGPVEHCDRFWLWLKAIGFPGGHRGNVVRCIATRLDTQFPGIYDGSAYEE